MFIHPSIIKITLSISLLFCQLFLVYGQIISSQLKDATSHTPIQYANIGIVGKQLGTISNAEGRFTLSLQTISDSDTLRISMIGYISKAYHIGDLKNTELPTVIYLEKQVIELQEAVVQKVQPFQIGLQKKYGYPIPFYKGAESKVAFPQKNYSHEIGTHFSNNKVIRLDSIRINFAECNVHTLKLRLNVYTIQKDSTFKNILRQPIYISLTKAEALNSPVVHMADQLPEIDGDFLVTLENYQQLERGASYLFANFKKRARANPTYYRNGSQSTWAVLKSKKAKSIALSIVVFGH